MVKDTEDAQVFSEEQKEMQKAAEQQGQEQTCAINSKANHVRRFIINRCQCDQHCERRNGQDRANQMADGIEILVAVWG